MVLTRPSGPMTKPGQTEKAHPPPRGVLAETGMLAERGMRA